MLSLPGRVSALGRGPRSPHSAGCSASSFAATAGGTAVWPPWAGQDHAGPCDCTACWVLRSGDEREVSLGVQSLPLVCAAVSGCIWDMAPNPIRGGAEVLGTRGWRSCFLLTPWDLGQLHQQP